MEIQGSPFACDVYDISRVNVNKPSKGLVGQTYNFESQSLTTMAPALQYIN
jgi:hypothetical protein